MLGLITLRTVLLYCSVLCYLIQIEKQNFYVLNSEKEEEKYAFSPFK